MEPTRPSCADPHQRFLCHFVNEWVDFRLPELEAAAEAAGVSITTAEADLASFRDSASGVYLPVVCTEGASGITRLAQRTVLVKRFIDVWGSGATLAELQQQLRAHTSDRWAPHLAEEVSFKIVVDAFRQHLSDPERLELINAVAQCVPFRGRVRLNSPDQVFVLMIDCSGTASEEAEAGGGTAAGGTGAGLTPSAGPSAPACCAGAVRFYFGRQVAVGQRDLAARYDLKQRNYIGTTSLDAELALLMANLGRVSGGHLVLDPYCGTAGCLVGAGHFGARVVGADLHGPALRGELRTRSRWSKCPQPDRQGIGLTFAQYGLPPPIGLVHADSSRAGCCFQTAGAGAIGGHTSRPLFDAIITDPPYGIRERSAALDDAALSRRTLTTVQHETHIPRTVAVSLRDILADLFHLAERSVVQGGWLVFLLPSMLPLDQALALLPPHPGLRLMSASEQRMGARWSRWCIAMLRLPDRQGIAKPDEPAVDEGVPPGLRSAIFRSRAEQAGGAPTMPVLHPELRNKVDRRKSGKTPRFGPVRATTGPCSATHCSVDAAVRVVGAGVVRLTIRATN